MQLSEQFGDAIENIIFSELSNRKKVKTFFLECFLLKYLLIYESENS